MVYLHVFILFPLKSPLFSCSFILQYDLIVQTLWPNLSLCNLFLKVYSNKNKQELSVQQKNKNVCYMQSTSLMMFKKELNISMGILKTLIS